MISILVALGCLVLGGTIGGFLVAVIAGGRAKEREQEAFGDGFVSRDEEIAELLVSRTDWIAVSEDWRMQCEEAREDRDAAKAVNDQLKSQILGEIKLLAERLATPAAPSGSQKEGN